MLGGKAIPLFKLLGFEVRLDWSWSIIAVLITWTLAQGLFPSYYPDLGPRAYWSMAVIAAAGLFASIILHELAHSVVARRYGLAINGITLFVFGGVAELSEEPERPKIEFVMAIAGPIASFLIALGCYLFVGVAAQLDWAAPVLGVASYLAIINLLLATFNLVPAFPLDGGRMLRAALWHFKGSLPWATRITAGIGSGFGIVLIVLGIYRVLTGDLIGGMWWFLIGLFVRAAAQMTYRQVVIREGLRGVPVRRLMSGAPVAVAPSLPLSDLIEDHVYTRHHKMFPVVEDDRLIGCVTLRDLKEVPRDRWPDTTVRAIARPCSDLNSIGPDTDALEALTIMHRTRNGRLMVTEADRLAGVLTLKDMLQFLSLKLELEDGKADAKFAGLPRADSDGSSRLGRAEGS